jgi:IMP and pyridine-specific 5'-nucleotidase
MFDLFEIRTEWVKGLLAVPFVLYSQPTGVFGDDTNVAKMAEEAHRRYAEIMRDVELMIDDHSRCIPRSFIFPCLGFPPLSFFSSSHSG